MVYGNAGDSVAGTIMAYGNAGDSVAEAIMACGHAGDTVAGDMQQVNSMFYHTIHSLN